MTNIETLVQASIALSREQDPAKFLEQIVLGAQQLTGADGGTLYTLKEGKTLHFEIVRTDSLNFRMGGTSGKPVTFPEIALYKADGQPNEQMVVVYAVVHDQTVNIADAYQVKNGFDFSGTRAFDQKTGYHSQSFLTVPLKDHLGDIIGVLQLLNARDKEGQTVPFSAEQQRFVEALASQAAIFMTNRRLVMELKQLFDSLVKVLADAIDEKSPYTGGHCRRVPIIADMLARAFNRLEKNPFNVRKFTEAELYEFNVAALLHDCGKVTTPERVMDKAKRLMILCDGFEQIALRFELVKRDKQVALFKAAKTPVEYEAAQKEYEAFSRQIDTEVAFIAQCNPGFVYVSPEMAARVKKIAETYFWQKSPTEHLPVLTPIDVENLSVPRGTLNAEEREIMNHHVVSTIHMLDKVPFPKHLKEVPEIADKHHERMDGKGYPRGLTGDQLSIRARMLCIADVFEALTAPDRPYKQPMTLSKALEVLKAMKEEGHIDPQLYDVFMQQKVYLEYAKAHLRPEQIDVQE